MHPFRTVSIQDSQMPFMSLYNLKLLQMLFTFAATLLLFQQHFYRSSHNVKHNIKSLDEFQTNLNGNLDVYIVLRNVTNESSTLLGYIKFI